MSNLIKVFSNKNEILIEALATDIILEHVIAICEGAWYDPEVLDEKSLCKHGCVNVLTRNKKAHLASLKATAGTQSLQI